MSNLIDLEIENNQYYKQSIISTILLMSDSYTFEYLFDRKYSDLERIRDIALMNYNKRIQELEGWKKYMV